MKYLIIGASASGLTAAKTIRKLAPQDPITVVSTDTQIYSRMMLRHYLSGEKQPDQLNFLPVDFFSANRIQWMPGKEVVRVLPAQKQIALQSGEMLGYDRLLLAAGAQYLIPPIEHFAQASNVYGLRDLCDAHKLNALAQRGCRCVVIGSGLVGLDAAAALAARGVSVSLIEMADRLSPLQLDQTAATSYQRLFEAAGCQFYLSAKAAGSQMDATGRITAVLLEGGEAISCDFVVVSAGVRPAIGFLEGSGLACARGVQVNERLQTNLPDIYAAGDITGLSGVWPNAMKQGEVAAKNLCGEETFYQDQFSARNTMNYYGLTTLTLGINQMRLADRVLSVHSENAYKQVVLRDGIVSHVILQGDTANNAKWLALVQGSIPVASLDPAEYTLLFGELHEATAPQTK